MDGIPGPGATEPEEVTEPMTDVPQVKYVPMVYTESSDARGEQTGHTLLDHDTVAAMREQREKQEAAARQAEIDARRAREAVEAVHSNAANHTGALEAKIAHLKTVSGLDPARPEQTPALQRQLAEIKHRRDRDYAIDQAVGKLKPEQELPPQSEPGPYPGAANTVKDAREKLDQLLEDRE